MPIYPVNFAGKVGLNTDISKAELPPEAWDDGLNVKFYMTGAELCPEAQSVYGATPITPFFGAVARAASGELLWAYAGEKKIYCTQGGNHYNITRQSVGVDVDYTATERNRWSGGNLGTLVVLANEVDVPQVWINPGISSKMQDLPNWPTTVRCKDIGVFKNFLIALDITKSGTRYPSMVKWSHPADPGTVPVSWDATDPTRDAGEYPLSETGSYCVFQLVLKDSNLIYKQDSVWSMQYIGGTFIFRFAKLFGEFGCPGKNQAVALPNGTHVVFTGHDLMQHDGQSAHSIAVGRVKTILNSIPEDSFQYAFMFSVQLTTEVWLCWKTSASISGANRALVWNWETQVFHYRTIPNLYYGVDGVLDFATGPDNWNSDSVTWDGDDKIWDQASLAPLLTRPVGFQAGGMLWMDSKSQNITTPAFLQRSAMGIPLKTGQAPDVSTLKFVRRVWPRLTGKVGDVVQIELGSVLELNSPIEWKAPVPFTIGVTKKVDCTLTGITFAFRISSTNCSRWVLAGVDWDYDFLGEI